jgi:hypothetical protein
MSDVPVGTVQDVLEWVGDDPDRAGAALAVEQTGVQRSTLMSKLEAIASQPEEADTMTDRETVDETEEIPAPEPPTVVELSPNDEDVTVGVVHRRDADVEVPDGSDLTPGDPDDEEAVIAAEQVEYFQVAGSPNGVVIALNGQAFALLPQTTASLKGALDRAIAGLTL